MAWAKSASEAPSGATDDFLVTRTSFTKFNMVLWHTLRTGSSNISCNLEFNQDDGTSKHATRYNIDGGTDSTVTSTTNLTNSSSNAGENFNVGYIINTGSDEMLFIGFHISTGNFGSSGLGSGTAPERMETVGKFVTTGDLDELAVLNASSADIATTSNFSWMGTD